MIHLPLSLCFHNIITHPTHELLPVMSMYFTNVCVAWSGMLSVFWQSLTFQGKLSQKQLLKTDARINQKVKRRWMFCSPEHIRLIKSETISTFILALSLEILRSLTKCADLKDRLLILEWNVNTTRWLVQFIIFH